MSEDTKYIFAVARIRVKEKSLLTDAEVRQMTAMPDEKAVLQYLTDRGWGDGSGKLDADQMLGCEEKKNADLMKELKIDPKIFEVLSYPKRFHNLKTAIKDVCTTDEHRGSYYPDDTLNRDNLFRILRDKNYNELPENMREPAQRAYTAMLKTGDGQQCDIIIDRACLDAMETISKKTKNPLLRDYEDSQVAIADIKIAVRAQATGKSLNFLKTALADCRSFEARFLAEAAVKDRKTLMDFLESHGFRDGSDALKESPSAFERWCDNELIRTIRPQKMNSVSAGPIVAYYLARENEMKTVRIILTGKANDFSEDEIRERVREMYG